ncbi:Serine/threonine-protein phosphatase [Aphelenchoides fujianensis]|nr:Serine/threonine-protein phosphatase [Aphelenchoides fujianensis]
MSRGAKQPEGVAVGARAAAIQRVVMFGVAEEITWSEESAAAPADEPVDIPHPLGSLHPLLVRLVRNGPRLFAFDYEELADVLERATGVFAAESSLLEVPVPCVVYGDLHGEYSDLHRGMPVFLGDFVDRGTHGVKVALLKLQFAERVHVVRGNHEEESLNCAYSFRRGGRRGMYATFKRMFMHLPLAVLAGGRVPAACRRSCARRPPSAPSAAPSTTSTWARWSATSDGGFRPNLVREPLNGIEQLFAADTVRDAAERLGVDLFPSLHGYALFSAPGYKGSNPKDVNMGGACLEIAADMRVSIKRLQVSVAYRRLRV